MARVTASELNEVFDTDLSNTALDAWIDTAHTVVNDVEGVDSSLSDDRLTQIEKMLAAGYASAQDPRLDSGSRETASVNYQRNDDYPNDYFGLAVALDPTGVIANQFKRTATLSVPDARGIDD